MKILVVGGTGFVGGYTSLFLRERGHDVTIMSRSRPRGSSALNGLPFVAGNYIEDSFDDRRLEGFDWLAFGAGSDYGDFALTPNVTEAEFFRKANIEALPRFFERAKRAGISRAVYMGSFYSIMLRRRRLTGFPMFGPGICRMRLSAPRARLASMCAAARCLGFLGLCRACRCCIGRHWRNGRLGCRMACLTSRRRAGRIS